MIFDKDSCYFQKSISRMIGRAKKLGGIYTLHTKKEEKKFLARKLGFS